MSKRIAMGATIMLSLVFMTGAAATAGATADQYMAVCIEKQEHGGQEYALTSWLDSRASANDAGKEHERSTRGHRWDIRTRTRPESVSHAHTAPRAAGR